MTISTNDAARRIVENSAAKMAKMKERNRCLRIVGRHIMSLCKNKTEFRDELDDYLKLIHGHIKDGTIEAESEIRELAE